MKKYLYDSKSNTFYPIILKSEYVSSGLWPENGVEVSEETFTEYQTPAPGKERIAGNDGYPAWADIPPPTHEEIVAQAEVEKQRRIDAANDYINSNQWPGKAAMDRLKDTDKARYNAWLDYLDTLEAVDTSKAPDIAWPDQPS